jgi:tetratricopeptide (TPR) repeat protein
VNPPSDVKDLIERGKAHYSERNPNAAIADFSAALQLDPANAEAYNNRGATRHSQGDFAAAISDLDAAIRLKPDYYQAYNNRGLARAGLRDSQAAIADFTEAIRLAPDYYRSYLLRANAYYHSGDLTRSRADYDAAYALEPAKTCGILAAIAASQALQDAAGNLAECDRYLQKNPLDYISYGRRGCILLMLGRDDEAQWNIQQRLSMHPEGKELVLDVVRELMRLRSLGPAQRTAGWP